MKNTALTKEEIKQLSKTLTSLNKEITKATTNKKYIKKDTKKEAEILSEQIKDMRFQLNASKYFEFVKTSLKS